MNTSQKPSRALQIGALLAAAAVTAVLFGSQLAIAERYTDRAVDLLASTRIQAVTQQTAAPAASQPRS